MCLCVSRLIKYRHMLARIESWACVRTFLHVSRAVHLPACVSVYQGPDVSQNMWASIKGSVQICTSWHLSSLGHGFACLGNIER